MRAPLKPQYLAWHNTTALPAGDGPRASVVVIYFALAADDLRTARL
jgi:hypothetical protein